MTFIGIERKHLYIRPVCLYIPNSDMLSRIFFQMEEVYYILQTIAIVLCQYKETNFVLKWATLFRICITFKGKRHIQSIVYI